MKRTDFTLQIVPPQCGGMEIKMKIGLISLGCPKNQLDLEVMAAKLKKNGHELVKEDIEADVVIVNTCAFIESALKESIDNILDVAWLKQNRSLKAIVVTGCMAERYGDQIYGELPDKVYDYIRRNSLYGGH